MKKQFYRLKAPQKINLLKTYFISQNIDLDKIDKLAEDLIKMIADDSIKNKDIDYDIENIKILKINKIQIINNELKIIKTKVSKKSTEIKEDKEEEIEEQKPKKKLKNKK
jgi:hypothetical protein